MKFRNGLRRPYLDQLLCPFQNGLYKGSHAAVDCCLEKIATASLWALNTKKNLSVVRFFIIPISVQ